MIELNKIYFGDCLEVLNSFPDESVNCCVTSPPYYGLRDYGVNGQIGLEETPELYVQKLVRVFGEVKRILREDGTLWLNLGDSYYNSNPGTGGACKLKGAGKAMTEARYTGITRTMPDYLKPKDLIGIPWMVAFALRANGWYLRQDIIWAKPNPMPESVTDRCTKAHEYIFLLSKNRKYYFDSNSIKEESKTFDNGIRDRDNSKLNNTPGRSRMAGLKTNQYEKANKRSVWTINTMPNSEAHFATFPELLISDCIKAGCPEDGVVLDPFIGAGTTGLVAKKLERNYIGIELNPEYIKIAERRIFNEIGLFL